MKNRTVLGIICIIMAVAITFVIAPVVNDLTSDTIKIIRLSQDVKQGNQISDKQVETVEVSKTAIPKGTITEKSAVIGKYAASDLYAGDFFSATKLTNQADTAEDAFSKLNGSQMAISITIDSFAAGLSGKLQNGDIVSILVTNKDTKETVIPGELKYVKVITTTTAGGVDKDSVKANDDGSYELPSTITLLVSTDQAKQLAGYEPDSTMQAALVYRGDNATAQNFLDAENEYLAKVKAGTAKSGTNEPAQIVAENKTGGTEHE